MLSELAIDNPKSFSDLVVIAKEALEGKEYKPAKVKLETKNDAKPVEEKKTVKKAAEKKTTVKKTTTKKKEEK